MRRSQKQDKSAALLIPLILGSAALAFAGRAEHVTFGESVQKLDATLGARLDVKPVPCEADLGSYQKCFGFNGTVADLERLLRESGLLLENRTGWRESYSVRSANFAVRDHLWLSASYLPYAAWPELREKAGLNGYAAHVTLGLLAEK